MKTQEKILAPSQELVTQLQADIRSDERLIVAAQEALVRLREQGDPHIAGVEAKLAEIKRIQQERQALLRELVQTRTDAVEAIEKVGG